MSGSRWSSIVVRQALASTIVMLVAIALLAVAARIVVERQQRADLLATIDTDMAGLVDGMMAGGAAEVARRIADRTALAGADRAMYRLADPHGRVLAGTLGAVRLDAARSQDGDVAAAGGRALARATRLRGGYTLAVARSLAPTDAVLARLTALFLIAAVPAAGLSLLVGALVARNFGTRVTLLNTAFTRFETGERAPRAQLPGGSDELAALAVHVDAHLARTQRLIEAQREVSDNIAHELRTPLGHLDARLLRALETGASAAIEQELNGARDDIRSIVSLFDALLDLALAEAGRTDESGTRMFDLSEQIANLAELYAASAEEAGLAFTTRIAPAVTMHGEPMAMTRAVANMLDNAFKFVPAGGQVRLTVAAGPRIVVEDDGPGVAEADRSQIFRRFRGSRAAARGHGLGLALVRVIATRHGLVARFEAADPGARFILTREERS